MQLASAKVARYVATRYYSLHTQPFNSPFSGTTQVSRYQNGKTGLDFTEARDSEWQWHQLGHLQSQWEMLKFDPQLPLNPLSDRHQIWLA